MSQLTSALTMAAAKPLMMRMGISIALARARHVGWTRAVQRLLLALAAVVGAVSCSESGTEPARARVVIDRKVVSVFEGRADTLKATAYDERGLVAVERIVWSSANRQIALVDSEGVVLGNTPGHTTVTATAGALTSTVDVTVHADAGKPMIQAIELSSRTIDLIGGDAILSVLVRARDQESGIKYLEVTAMPSSRAFVWPLQQSCMMVLESGTASDGAWRCTIRLHRYSAPGEWRLRVFAYDWRPPLPNFDSSAVTFTVSNARPDDTPPTLTELSFSEERTNEAPYGESRIMVISATDEESGMLTAEFFLDSDSIPGIYGCGAERPRPHPIPWNPVPFVTGRCLVPLVSSNTPVLRTISLVRLTDARGNVRLLTAEELTRAGFVTRIDIRK